VKAKSISHTDSVVNTAARRAAATPATACLTVGTVRNQDLQFFLRERNCRV